MSEFDSDEVRELSKRLDKIKFQLDMVADYLPFGLSRLILQYDWDQLDMTMVFDMFDAAERGGDIPQLLRNMQNCGLTRGDIHNVVLNFSEDSRYTKVCDEVLTYLGGRRK